MDCIVAENKKEFTILITDDEKSNLDILGSILSPTYNLLISRNGPRALELAKEHRPDLILLDVLMPGMSGFEVITKLQESEATSRIPVIFITGLTSAHDEEKGFFLGAVDYIAKPFNKAIVKARVNTHIRIVDQMRIIERIGMIDPLTRIPNRRGFEDRLGAEWNRAMREKKPMGILVIDIDNFKIYNDTYGHQQGDAALVAFAELASKALLRTTDYAARWGGEEFVVLLPGSDMDGAEEVAERVRESTEAAIVRTESGDETRMTVSVGLNSAVPGADDSVDEYIRAADQALYQAKEQGRNRVVRAPQKD